MTKKKQAKGHVRHFSINSFLRKIDKELLIRLLKRFKIDNENFINIIRDKTPKEIIKHYLVVSLKYNTEEFEQQCAYINDFEGEAEAYFILRRAKELKLNTNQTPLNVACELYLSRKRVFEEVKQILQAEYSKGFNNFLSSSFESLNLQDSLIKQMETSISKFNKSSGQGSNVDIEYHQYEDKDILIIWNEGYKTNFTVFDEAKELTDTEILPAIPNIIICYPKAGKLRIKAKNKELINHIRKTIGFVCLDNANYFPENSTIELKLNKFKESIRNFPVDNRVIQDVELTGIKITRTPNKHSQSIIEIRVKENIYGELEELGIELTNPLLTIKSVRLSIKLRERKKKRTVELSLPNHTRLNDTHDDNEIENMLIDWGVIHEYRNSALPLQG